MRSGAGRSRGRGSDWPTATNAPRSACTSVESALTSSANSSHLSRSDWTSAWVGGSEIVSPAISPSVFPGVTGGSVGSGSDLSNWFDARRLAISLTIQNGVTGHFGPQFFGCKAMASCVITRTCPGPIGISFRVTPAISLIDVITVNAWRWDRKGLCGASSPGLKVASKWRWWVMAIDGCCGKQESSTTLVADPPKAERVGSLRAQKQARKTAVTRFCIDNEMRITLHRNTLLRSDPASQPRFYFRFVGTLNRTLSIGTDLQNRLKALHQIRVLTKLFDQLNFLRT